MQHWPWFVGGTALAGVIVGHWLLLHRMMAVSGRFTALVNRVRFGPEKKVEMTQAELEAALLAATAAEFGDEVVDRDDAPAPSASVEREMPKLTGPQGPATHFLFLGGLIVGGLVSMLLAGHVTPSMGLRGDLFNGFFHSKASSAAALVGGGVLVGFGTRMAAGCTSGHGLCGVSRFQKGSILSTMAFFGMGIVVSFALRFAL